MPDVPDATDNESAREEEKENRVDETIIFKDNDNKESAMEMDSGNETINDSITFPNQTGSSATDSFVERKESIEGGERTDLLHVVATGNDDPSSSDHYDSTSSYDDACCSSDASEHCCGC